MSQAQIITSPLSSDASRVAPTAPQAAARVTSLSLPFFDDFTTPLEGNPLLQNWTRNGGAYVTNRLSVLPLTRGTAILDGLKANGLPYSGANPSSYGPTDTLTTQAIDLSGVNSSSNVFLSFGWQSGSVIAPPTRSGTYNVSLELQFKNASGRWNSIWTQRSNGQVTRFRQRIVPLTDPQYFHANFQFRFLSTGTRATNLDIWGLDYIYLNSNRSASDTTFTDIGTTTGLSNPLRRFAAMPWWQYNAAASAVAELSPRDSTGIINLSNPSSPPTPITWQGTVRDLTSGSIIGTWLQSGRSQQNTPRRDNVIGNIQGLPLLNITSPKRLRYTLALSTLETDNRTLPNDTISRDVMLNNYYAYDDGTAEFSIDITSAANTVEYLASRFDLNEPDQVLGVQISPVFYDPSEANRSVTVYVWANNNGLPGAVLGTATGIIANPLAPGQVFAQVNFSPSVPVSGSFFIGYSRRGQAQLPYAADANNIRPTNSLFFTRNGVWQPTSTTPTGGALYLPYTILMRAVMTHNVPVTGSPTVTSTQTKATTAEFALYPNPAHGTVNIVGPTFTRATVLDALGRTVWEQPVAEAGQTTLTLAALPVGMYFVRLTLPDGRSATQRLALE